MGVGVGAGLVEEALFVAVRCFVIMFVPREGASAGVLDVDCRCGVALGVGVVVGFWAGEVDV